jgi:hypothetical protein
MAFFSKEIVVDPERPEPATYSLVNLYSVYQDNIRHQIGVSSGSATVIF